MSISDPITKESKLQEVYYDILYCLSIVILFAWFFIDDFLKGIKSLLKSPDKPLTHDEHLHDWEDWL